jgi:hypothetical protein
MAYRRGTSAGFGSPSTSLRDRAQPPSLRDRDGVKQYAGGSWPGFGSGSAPLTDRAQPPDISEVLMDLTKEIKEFRKWKPKVYTELIKKDLDTLDGIERNRGM